MRFRLRTLMIVLALGLALYVGSYAWFSATPYRFDLASGPQHYLVIFSMNTDRHSAARSFYWPLILASSGHRYCPTRDEHEQLMAARGHAYGP